MTAAAQAKAERRQRRAAKAYGARNRILVRLGFADYAAYLASPLWRKIRRRALTDGRGERRQCRCGEPAEQIHHARYTEANLTGRSLKGLVPACDACHRKAEWNDRGEKLPPDEATQRLRRVGNLARKERLYVPFRQRLVALRDPNAASHMESMRRPL